MVGRPVTDEFQHQFLGLFGNRTVILRLTGEQLREAFVNGFLPVCGPVDYGNLTGRLPRFLG